ncbi:hypothetical protein R1flu_001727 [Riccia fluitans]|uniref:Exocyst subunit Exo70 family protein n=1 Tax=Riccia fluitans TaxID=41844 RepID=A0ABD1Y454_9MARC
MTLSAAEDTLEKLPALGPCDCLFFTAGPERMRVPELERPSFGYKEMSKFSVQLFLRNGDLTERGRRKGQGATQSSKSKQFSAYVHHSVKFIKHGIQRLIDEGGDDKYNVRQMVQELTTGLSLRLLNYSSDKVGRLDSGPDARVWIQQTSYQLGSLPYIGHQFMFTASKLIAEVAESLVCLDPFHEGVAQTYDNLYFLFQLMEKLLSDYFYEWMKAKQVNVDILKDTLDYHFSTVKFLGRYPNWNSLVVEYSNRLTGEIKAQLDAAGQYMENYEAEGSQHTALLNLIQMATCANADT